MRRCSRRRALQAAGIGLVGTLSGCSALPTGGSTAQDRSFDRLHLTAVYVDDDVDLSVPDEVETVSARNNADLLVLPGETDVGPGRVVEWLDADRVVALTGADAEATWLSWARSDAFADAFENGGFGDSEPDPSLVVGAAIGLHVTTYRYTWADGPRNRDVLRALDEALVDVAQETPRE